MYSFTITPLQNTTPLLIGIFSAVPDAALRFDAEVSRALNLITQSPGRWALGSHGTRRLLLRQYPFMLIYRERSDGNIQVLAVAHTSRKPEYWKDRV